MYLVILVGLVFPFPVAVYCLILTMLNRRPHPVMVTGTWDFAEILFASSGFLVFGGPAILAGFHQRYREFLLYGGLRPVAGVTDAVSYLWVAAWVAYFVVIAAVAGFMLWRRRRATAVYNVEPQAFHECLAAVLDQLKLEWVRNGDRVYIDRREDLPADDWPRKLVLALDVSPTLRHVTLFWPADAGPLRRELEYRLAEAFLDVRTPRNPVGGWALSVAGCLFSIMFFTVAAVAFAVYATLKS